MTHHRNQRVGVATARNASCRANGRRRTGGAPWSFCCAVGFGLFLFAISGRSQAQEEPASTDVADSGQTSAGDDLSVEQARLADRFKRLELVVGRLAELSAGTDPRRARLLRNAIAQSRDQDINVRFEAVVKLLEDERLSAATTNQTELHKELDSLLALLLKADRDKELASQRDRVRKYLKELSLLIRLQKGIRARTEGGDEFRGLGDDQKRVAGETGKLGEDIDETEGPNKTDGEAAEDSESRDQPADSEAEHNDDSGRPGESGDSGKSPEPGEPSQGEPGESQPNDSQPAEGNPSQPGQGQPGSPSPPSESDEPSSQQADPAQQAADRLRKAREQMNEAAKKLDEAEREGAVERQREALKQLEQAKAELERVLRQLREEELERTLTQLAARFRKMLELQVAVYEGTMRLDRIPKDERGHDAEIEAAGLARQESQIINEADKALLLLREDGSSVAFPEAVEQMRNDMRQVAERLTAVKVDGITQGLEQDIIAALEETIAALDKAMEDLEKNKSQAGQPTRANQPTEPDLVDKLAELRMIRSLQVKIYQRTQRYGKMIEGEQAETQDLLEALKELAERQQRVQKALSDLEEGRND